MEQKAVCGVSETPQDVIKVLKKYALEMRKLSTQMTFSAGSQGGHIGSAFSIIDILAVLYFHVMHYRVEDPDWADRDRFILSKGHGVLALYTALALAGFVLQEDLSSFEKDHTQLAGHPCSKGVKGIECPSGSLGHGLCVAAGIALGAKMNGRSFHTYVIIGDGESEEGSIWEAALFARQYNLDNLTCIVDVNGFQYGGRTSDLIDPSPMGAKWAAFGWNVVECDGHDMQALLQALGEDTISPKSPRCIIANTIKGKGVSFMENNNSYHHARLTPDQYIRAMAELER